MMRVVDIQRAVAAEHGIPFEQMRGRANERKYAWARQEAMFLSRDMIPRLLFAGKYGDRLSQSHIAMRFDRDRTTVRHAIRAVARRIATDADVRRRIDSVSVRLLMGEAKGV